MIIPKRASLWRLVLGLPVLALLGVIGDTFIEDDNFRVVDPSVFRSGQLRIDEWTESYDEHQFRSVINLRGSNEGRAWYSVEVRFATEHGLEHYDYPLSARIVPTLEQMDQLVSLMRSAPKPLLIHCDGGADRSGLAAALYVYALEGAPPEEAARQLSFWYGHVPWMSQKTGAMDTALATFIGSRPPASGKPVGFHQQFIKSPLPLQG